MMRFEFYHAGLDNVAKLSIDGTVSNSLHFSHWRGNTTPAAVKADTSTEIALNLVGSENYLELTEGIELVTNNHFDTDGALSVWTMLAGKRALDLREKLIAAAEAGDFSEYSTDDGVRANIVIQGSDLVVPEDKDGSPLARHLSGENVTDEARAYELVLPEVERVLTRTDEYEPLWRDAWEQIAAGLESFARGASKVEEQEDVRLSVVTLAPELFGPQGFDLQRHVAPFTAISRHARGQLYLIATPVGGGWSYRADYPYYSWAETVVRPHVARRDFAALVARLNALEKKGEGRWQLDERELSSAFKFMDESGRQRASGLAPERVTEELRAALNETKDVSAGARVG
ncbi:MAG TPA: DUF6687 family protein [Pyrinomonadaceae bacterium]|jgi:hypothetical protein